MLSNPSQYAPQSLIPQFPGWQARGWPQMSPGLFGQPGAYNGNAQFGNAQFGNAQFGHESGQAAMGQPFGQPFGLGQQFPFGAQPNPFLSSFAGHAGAHIPAHQIVPVLGQLAQQIAVQGAVAQQ